MVKRTIQMLGLILGGMAGDQAYAWTHAASLWTEPAYGIMQQSGAYYTNIGLGAFLGLAAATLLAGPLIRWMQQGAERAAGVPTLDLAAGSAGLLAGLAVSALLYPAVAGLSGAGLLL